MNGRAPMPRFAWLRDVRRTLQWPPAWPPARRRIAALATFTGTVTAAIAVLAGGAGSLLYAVLFVAGTLVTLMAPALMPVPVIAGQLLAAGLLLGRDPGTAVLALPVIAGVVLTAELLATAGRLDAPVVRDARDGLHRAGLAALIASVVCAAVLLVGDLPGPAGLAAILLASVACIVLAMMLLSLPGRIVPESRKPDS